MKVYRYIDMIKLKDIIKNKRLYFANPFIDWPDTNEGVLYRLAQNSSTLSIIEKHLSDYKYREQIIKMLNNGGLYKNPNNGKILDWFGMRCQSWSMVGNDDEMWKNYSGDNTGVCITVDTARLLSLHYNGSVEGFRIEYKDNLEIADQLKYIIGRHGEFYYPFVLKYKLNNFKFENEYRIYVDRVYSVEDNHNGVNVNIDYPINEFIEEIIVHPKASDKYVELVNEYIKEYKINFVGR